MKINRVDSTNFKVGINGVNGVNGVRRASNMGGVKISSIANRSRIYLYNEINNLTKEFKIPATFKTNEIELPSVTENILSKLKELGIKFNPNK